MIGMGKADFMYRDYIFDLYGTLVDIRTDEERAVLWKKTARYYALQGAQYSPAEIKKRYGELVAVKERQLAGRMKAPCRDVEIKLEDVFARLFREKGVKPSKRQVFDACLFFRNESLCYIRLFPGAKKLLQRLKEAGKGVYLLSNAQRIFTEPEMRMLGIYDLFDGILYSSDCGMKKPSPLFFDRLFEKFGLEKQNAVMIGNDCEADVGGAHAYGLASMYVHTNQSTPLRGALPADCKRLASIGEAFGVAD